MPNILEEIEVDSVIDVLEMEMTAAEEEAAFAQLSVPDQVGDLGDGGMVGGVRLTPLQNGVKQEKGRAVTRRAWRWDGTESLLPLAWDTDGKRHDGARFHLLKRHCICCKFSGFRGVQCPACIKNNCTICRSSTVRGKIIPCYYLKEEDVPFPVRLYGSIDCFLVFCVRRGERGFKTEEDMRVHARTRHRMEYQAHLDSRQTEEAGELTTLREQVAMLTAAMLNGQAPREEVAAQPAKPRGRRKKAAPVTAGTSEAPLYVSDKDQDSIQ